MLKSRTDYLLREFLLTNLNQPYNIQFPLYLVYIHYMYLHIACVIGCGECGSRHGWDYKIGQLGSTLMVRIYYPCQLMLYCYYVFNTYLVVSVIAIQFSIVRSVLDSMKALHARRLLTVAKSRFAGNFGFLSIIDASF